MNNDHVHELAMMAARFTGESCAGHNAVGDKVSAAYIAAYKAMMSIGKPTSPQFYPGAYHFASVVACGKDGSAYHPPNSVFIHSDGSVHANPEY